MEYFAQPQWSVVEGNSKSFVLTLELAMADSSSLSCGATATVAYTRLDSGLVVGEWERCCIRSWGGCTSPGLGVTGAAAHVPADSAATLEVQCVCVCVCVSEHACQTVAVFTAPACQPAIHCLFHS